jgi:hypothetical protein
MLPRFDPSSSSSSAPTSESEDDLPEVLPQQHQREGSSHHKLESNSLQLLYDPSKGDETSFSKNGVDMARIIKRLDGDGACDCKCYTKFDRWRLKTICETFWGLSKAAQDKALWSAGRAADSNQRSGIDRLAVHGG